MSGFAEASQRPERLFFYQKFGALIQELTIKRKSFRED
jgi:hypothetical protein